MSKLKEGKQSSYGLIPQLEYCNKCKNYSFTSDGYCTSCDTDRRRIIKRTSIALCKEFDVKIDDFNYFLKKYFPDFHPFKSKKSKFPPKSYGTIICCIFYCYSNIDKDKAIQFNRIKGFALSHHLASASKFQYYRDFTIGLFKDKYGHFLPEMLSREAKLRQNIKTVLGKLKKPVMYKHVLNMVDAIPLEFKWASIKSIAVVYVLLYFKYYRGQQIQLKNWSLKDNAVMKGYNTMYNFDFQSVFKDIVFKEKVVEKKEDHLI